MTLKHRGGNFIYVFRTQFPEHTATPCFDRRSDQSTPLFARVLCHCRRNNEMNVSVFFHGCLVFASGEEPTIVATVSSDT